MTPISERLLKFSEVNVGNLHADKARLPGRETKAYDRKENKGHPSNLSRNSRKIGHEQDQSSNRQTKQGADFTGMNDISFQEAGNAIDVVVIKAHVIIAKQIDLRARDTARLEVVLNLFELVQIVTHVVEALHRPSHRYVYYYRRTQPRPYGS